MSSIEPENEGEVKIPWHFWIFVILAGGYLLYRLVQISIMAISNLF